MGNDGVERSDDDDGLSDTLELVAEESTIVLSRELVVSLVIGGMYCDTVEFVDKIALTFSFTEKFLIIIFTIKITSVVVKRQVSSKMAAMFLTALLRILRAKVDTTNAPFGFLLPVTLCNISSAIAILKSSVPMAFLSAIDIIETNSPL